LCDGTGHPLDFELAPGQAHESTLLESLLESADASVVDGEGEAVAWPAALAADKGYRADWIDETLIEIALVGEESAQIDSCAWPLRKEYEALPERGRRLVEVSHGEERMTEGQLRNRLSRVLARSLPKPGRRRRVLPSPELQIALADERFPP